MHEAGAKKGAAVEKVWQGVELEKVLAIEKMRYELQQAKLDLERQNLNLIIDGKLHEECCALLVAPGFRECTVIKVI